MTFNPAGYLLILIIPSADAIDDDMSIGWRHLTPDLLQKRGACSIVSLDNIQEELIDLGNHLFKEDGVGVDALWYEVWINEMRTWWYLMYPMGYVEGIVIATFTDKVIGMTPARLTAMTGILISSTRWT
jgi:hypothetical protein